MKKTFYTNMILSLALLVNHQFANGQAAFKNENTKMVAKNHSGCAVTIVDWNGDGLDDIIRLSQGHDCFVEVQQTNSQFYTVHLGDFGSGNSAWAMTCADVDHNGYVDVIADGPGAIGLLKTDNNGTGAALTWLSNSGFFLQNATFADFNNDGWIDLFCCDDNDASHMYLNDGTGNLLVSTLVSFAVNPGMVYGNDPADSGNYGSVWVDFDNDGDMDLFVAHCRQASSSTSDFRRKDRLFVNDGNNNFTDQSSAYGIEVSSFAQTWTASFGDIDNDGDLDLMVTNHDRPSQILENDGTGHYTDITPTTGFCLNCTDTITPIESVMEDFDNDGYADIFVTGSNSRYFHNNGDKTFTRVNNLFNNNRMESFAIGDLNHDGYIDIYASYAGIYTNPTSVDDVIWTNKGGTNHFITLNLKGTVSNHSAIGARAMLYSSLGIQIREVRAGESYGTCNSEQLHFGMGAVTTIDSIIISWPAGGSQTIYAPAVDQFLTIIENTCVSPPSNLVANGPLHICAGQTLTVTAPAGYNYLWSNGDMTPSINITQIGEYNVQITEAGNNCPAVSATIIIPDETPVISAAGTLEFCSGQTVDLFGPAGVAGYMWSNGETTQNITVAQSGTYTLDIQGFCSTWTSNQIAVNVHTAVAPTSNNVTLPVPGSTTITATGLNVSWYDAITGGNLMATGNNFTTPFLNNTTDYYVQTADVYGGGLGPVGIKYANPTYSGNTTNAKQIFTVTSNCTLISVKVYTDTPGDRLIELRDANNVLVNSLLVNVAVDSQVVMLNFPLTPGIGYRLGTNTGTNTTNFGFNSPRFKRNDTGVSYPYTIQNALSITGSDQGSSRYYYFFDWQVDVAPISCPSTRLLVTVTVTGTVGINEVAAHDMKIYPNPAKDKLFIEMENPLKSMITISDQVGRILQTETIQGKNNTIDISGIAAGIYHLKVQRENSEYIYKVIIQ